MKEDVKKKGRAGRSRTSSFSKSKLEKKDNKKEKKVNLEKSSTVTSITSPAPKLGDKKTLTSLSSKDLSHHDNQRTPASPSPLSPTGTRPPRKSLLERLKESTHLNNHHSKPSTPAHPPVNNSSLDDDNEIDPALGDVRVLDVDEVARNEKESKKFRSDSIVSDTIDDSMGRLPGEYDKDKDDGPTRQDSSGSYTEMGS